MTKTAIYVDLIMDNGDVTSVQCPEDSYDELHESLRNAMKRGDWWTPSDIDSRCEATYRGRIVSQVAMPRVVGMV